MEKWKMLMVAGIGATALMASVYAQEQDQAPGTYRTPEEMQKPAEEGINSGWVVAYGVLLKRPYFVEFRDDTVRINNVQYLPRKKNPTVNSPGMLPPMELNAQEFRLAQEIDDTFNVYWKAYGWEQAHQMVLDKYRGHPLISSIEFTPSGRSVWITFSDGARWNQGLIETVDYGYGPPLSGEDRMAIRRNEVNLVRSDLMKGHLMIFGYSGYESIDSGEKGSQLVGVVNSIKGGTMSLEEGRKQLKGILGYDKLVEEVMSHIESW
jgi:hypothetical protein